MALQALRQDAAHKLDEIKVTAREKQLAMCRTVGRVFYPMHRHHLLDRKCMRNNWVESCS
eukprot:2241762-Amphidinium_carterae.2